MSAQQPKKLLIINILDILKRYTDENHRLSQKEIAEILRKEYGMTADRKTIRRNLINLMECGYNIEYSETIRMVSNAKTGELEESYIWSDFYLERDFTDGELRLLIDSLLFSQHIPYSQCKELVEKLENLSNIYFRSRIRHIAKMPDDKSNNKQLFLNIELLDEAISRKRKVSFRYMEYGTDKKTHPKRRGDGTVREYIINPYVSDYLNLELYKKPYSAKDKLLLIISLEYAHTKEHCGIDELLNKYTATFMEIAYKNQRSYIETF